MSLRRLARFARVIFCFCPLLARAHADVADSAAFQKKIIYADQLPGIHLDSSLSNGGGTDDRLVLQTALDEIALAGGGTLVMTGCSLLSGSLALSSNEMITGTNEQTCGLFQLPDHHERKPQPVPGRRFQYRGRKIDRERQRPVPADPLQPGP